MLTKVSGDQVRVFLNGTIDFLKDGPRLKIVNVQVRPVILRTGAKVRKFNEIVRRHGDTKKYTVR